MRLQNLHTHTTFCDGKNTVEEMIQAAIGLGMNSLGFSGHSWLAFSNDWTLQREDIPRYRAEVLHLKEQYRDRLQVFLGLEQDVFSPPPEGNYDYIIGSAHYVEKDGTHWCVEETEEALIRCVQEVYGGDFMALAEDYFALAATIPERTGCRIVGHLDVLCKFNEGDRLFDTSHPRYVAAAMAALEELAKKDIILEINTGAMASGRRSIPYPAPPLLKAACEKKIPICITGDSHSTTTLLHAFPKAAALAEICGYRECMYLTEGGFVPGPLPDKL